VNHPKPSESPAQQRPPQSAGLPASNCYPGAAPHTHAAVEQVANGHGSAPAQHKPSIAREGADGESVHRAMTTSNQHLTGNVERLSASNASLSGANRDLSASNTLLSASNADLTQSNTDLSGSNRALTSSNSALHASNIELDMFAHVLAHDLKEPVRGIRLLAQFVREDNAGRLDAATVQRLLIIDQLCDRAVKMVNVVLEAARVGSTPLKQEPVSVHELAAEALQGIGALIDESGAEVKSEECCQHAFAYVDRVQMGRALRNLVTNGLRHNPAPGKSVTVNVRERESAEGRDRQLTVTVTDNGPGISADDAQRVFQMFRQLSPAARPDGTFPAQIAQGTGAGLAIVKKIVERHGGRVWVEQRGDGQSGAVFCMTLPRA
jgi:two-component system, chemotaxis family, sensor kinase Cph1